MTKGEDELVAFLRDVLKLGEKGVKHLEDGGDMVIGDGDVLLKLELED